MSGIALDITDHKQADEALRQSERRLRVFFDSDMFGALCWTTDGRITQANDKFLQLLGYSRDDLQQHPLRWTDITPPEYRQADEDSLAEIRARAVNTPYEKEMIRKDGSRVPILVGAASFDEPRQQGVAFILDITDRKQSEQALRQSEERYRTLFNTIDEGFCIVEVLLDEHQKPFDHRFLATNPAFSTMLQVPQAEGRTARALFPDLEPEWYDLFGNVALTGQPARYLQRVQAWDRWFEGYAFRVGPPEKHHVGILFTDVTGRQQAEQALQRRNQHLQLLHQASARLLVGQHPVELLRQLHTQIAQVFGADAFMLYQAEHGSGHLRLLACAGISEEERQKLETLRYGRAVCARPAEALQPIIATHLQDRPAPNRRFVRKLGFRSYLYYPLIINHRLHGTVAFASRQRDDYDRTDLDFFHTIAGTLAEALERERLEAELQRHAADLERTVQERTAKLRETVAELEGFSYSLIHDLRAPLRAMQAYAAIVEEDAGSRLQPDESDLLHKISSAAQRMDQLVTDSLNYTRILRETPALGTVNLGALLRGMVDTYPNLQPQRANVSIELGDLLVHGSQAALTQIFSNLLGNAVKFIAPGVRPRVRVWAEPAPSTLNQQPSSRVCVADNGIGIPKDQQEKIFGMFQRLHRAEEYPGTGIGLALVKKSLERTGGEITVESEPGKGSRFCVLLPLAAPAAEAQGRQ